MMGPKHSRKKDFEKFEKLFNDNEYWPVKITCKFDKNFWFYVVNVTPTNDYIKNHPHNIECNGFIDDQGIKIINAGFIIVECRVRIHEPNTIGWGPDKNTKLSQIYFSQDMLIVREDEWKKFLRKNYRYQYS